MHAQVGRDRLPFYPFRDDGEKLWDAIWDYTTEYVGAIYATDMELREDKELQAWCAELADPEQGSVNGMPSKVSTAKELVEILTTIIFTSGPGHCAGACHPPPLRCGDGSPVQKTKPENCQGCHCYATHECSGGAYVEV